MGRYLFPKFIAAVACLLLASACATSPIAKEYRQEAKAENLTFPMVYGNPDAYVGDIVLWGGVIIETTALKEGTRIIVLETALGDEERPRGTKYSQGRFIAMSPNFLDPALYKKGRKITVAGEVSGKKEMTLGETTYTYPVVTVKQIHLWEKRPRYRYYYPYGYPYDYWGWGPYWDWYPDYDGFDGGFEGDDEWDDE